MILVMFDCLERFCAIENDIMIEGIDGYRILEDDTSTNGQVYVVYGLLSAESITERRFTINSSDVQRFMQLHKYYCENIHRSNLLIMAANEVKSYSIMGASDLRAAAKTVYNKYYLHFVSMNLGLDQFIDYLDKPLNIPKLSVSMVC